MSSWDVGKWDEAKWDETAWYAPRESTQFDLLVRQLERAKTPDFSMVIRNLEKIPTGEIWQAGVWSGGMFDAKQFWQMIRKLEIK